MDVGRKGTDSLMCGIVGLAAAPSRPLPPDIDWAVAALSHRGPDAHGAFISAPFALGHTRLSIIDLSEAGAQPMHSADGRLVMTYNGEIYNFAELKRDLDQHGIRLRGHSDTEVLLESYRLYGPDVLARLNGIFALGIVDLEKREMVVARDAAGIKPVYIADGPFGFAFASEIKALLAVAPIERTIDADAVRQYLTFLWSPGERTMLRGVKKLDPGRALLVRDGSVARSWQFATLPAYDPRRDWTVETCSNALATSLDEAVERQMISDAPVGAFLSGGVDSTAIVAAAKRTAPGLRCYTMAIAEGEQREMIDDLPYARLAAKSLGVPLVEVPITASDIAEGVARMVHDLDEPLADPASINLRFISKAARADGIKVLLSGTGGDDVLSGYRRHQALALEPMWRRTPRSVRGGLAKLSASGWILRAGLRRAAKLLANVARDENERIAHLFAWIAPGEAAALLAPELRYENDGAGAMQPLLDHLAQLSDMPPLERCLSIEKRFFLADHNLNYTDKMGMAAGVEIRVPFLDRDFLSFAATIPAEWKMRGMQPKWLFKQSQRGRIPGEILSRSKTGFGVPLRAWMRGGLAPMCRDLLSMQSLSRHGLFDAAAVERLQSADAAGSIDASFTLFSVMCIELWCREFRSTATSPANVI